MTDLFNDLDSNLGDEPEAPRPQSRNAARRLAAQKRIEDAAPEVKKDGRVCIILQRNENIPPTGLFVGHNGTPYIVKAGEPVMVPQGVVNVLNDAVMDMPIIGDSQSVIGYQKQLRFPFSFATMPV